MSISNFSLVNQKLAFAKSLLDLVNQSPMQAGTSAHRLQQEALLSSVLLQLVVAFHFYLREVADRVHLKNSGAIESLQDLKLACEQYDRSALEVDELLNLSQAPGGWLAEITRYKILLFSSPQKQKEKKSFGTENQIAFIDLTGIEEERAVALTAAMLEQWLAEFRQLVLRHRDTGAEF